LEEEGLSLAVVDARFVKPLDSELILAEARATGLLLTVEENALQGGFGSAVLELLADQGAGPRVLRFGVPDRFVEQGTQDELRQRIGIDAASLVAQVREHFAQGASAQNSRITLATGV
jgi:1-deoxy-D-xylulose-5-phosphate synthase